MSIDDKEINSFVAVLLNRTLQSAYFGKDREVLSAKCKLRSICIYIKADLGLHFSLATYNSSTREEGVKRDNFVGLIFM